MKLPNFYGLLDLSSDASPSAVESAFTQKASYLTLPQDARALDACRIARDILVDAVSRDEYDRIVMDEAMSLSLGRLYHAALAHPNQASVADAEWIDKGDFAGAATFLGRFLQIFWYRLIQNDDQSQKILESLVAEKKDHAGFLITYGLLFAERMPGAAAPNAYYDELRKLYPQDVYVHRLAIDYKVKNALGDANAILSGAIANCQLLGQNPAFFHFLRLRHFLRQDEADPAIHEDLAKLKQLALAWQSEKATIDALLFIAETLLDEARGEAAIRITKEAQALLDAAPDERQKQSLTLLQELCRMQKDERIPELMQALIRADQWQLRDPHDILPHFKLPHTALSLTLGEGLLPNVGAILAADYPQSYRRQEKMLTALETRSSRRAFRNLMLQKIEDLEKNCVLMRTLQDSRDRQDGLDSEDLQDPVQTQGLPDSPDLKSAPAPDLPLKTGRNDPCPCGSGRKYKKCCGKA